MIAKKWEFIKLQKNLCMKGHSWHCLLMNYGKGNLWHGKIFTNRVSDRGLILRICLLNTIKHGDYKMNMDLNIYFFSDGTFLWTTFVRCWKTLITRKCNSYEIQWRWLVQKWIHNYKFLIKDIEKLETLCTVVETVKWHNNYEKQYVAPRNTNTIKNWNSVCSNNVDPGYISKRSTNIISRIMFIIPHFYIIQNGYDREKSLNVYFGRWID